ncbi:coiled-coil domain-containing protein 63-like [Crassostrea angulata]|uniref:coiled-coil domain-containing protein 63-like n=1 Tax=Magallana angulata TaxID=2784310 RepID=UPI0022B10F00|nr:coiled-coil domain-containing protein 63-like [Crassostrea angulata]
MRRANQRDAADEMMDEASQSAEMLRLQRKLRVMENDRKAYEEDARNLLRKQECEIQSLLKENREIRTVLKLANSDKNRTIDIQDTERLVDLIDNLDMYNAQADAEEARIKELDAEIRSLDNCITSYNKQKGGVTEAHEEQAIQKTIRVMENRLDKEMAKFNQQLSVNSRLRKEIDHLRQDRLVFNGLFKKLSKELNDTKKSMNEIVTEASQAYEDRDEAQNKMLALKERSEKDIAQQEVEMKELYRIIDHDNRLKEFMMFKTCERSEFKEEEEAKKKKCSGGDKDIDAEKVQIQTLEEAFQRIREATGEDDVDVIVTNFIRRENENFALFQYVNEINDEVEQLHDEIYNMQAEIKQFEKDDIKNEGVRVQMLKDLEEKSDKIRQQREATEEKNVKVKKVLDELRSGVELLFRSIQCDSSVIQDMLGSDNRVTNKNILQYMGIIEQKTMELLQAQQYLQMKANPPKQEKRGDSTTPVHQQTQKVDLPPTISIQPPNAGEDDDIFNDYGEEMDLRPLTQEELRSAIINKVTRKSTCQRLYIRHARSTRLQ